MPMLSVLYVIRNEQDTLEKSLNSIKPIADEIVIVDTGSFDRSLQICRKFSYTRIFSHAWVHDYSKTKNYGISQCKGDWILCMDGDEMLDPASASAIKTAVNNAKPNIAGFSIHVADHEQTLDPLAPTNPNSFFPSPQCRLFRRDKQIQFEGRILERPDQTVKKVGGIDLLNAKIHHFLWRGKGKEFKEGRLRYYQKLGLNMPNGEVQAPPEPKGVNPTAGIVVCAHNVLNVTKECVTSIAQHTKLAHSIHFIDNGSNDGTFEYMRGVNGKNPFKFQNNVGIAQAKNMGAKEILAMPHYKYICFLDNDTKVSDGWLEKMIKIMDSNPKIGMVGPLSNAVEGSQNIYSNNDSQKPIEQREPDHFVTDWISGFCMVISLDALKRVGLFDESLGQYGYEDRDLCERMKKAGFEIAVANRVFVDHKGKITLIENRIDWQKLMQDSATKYAKKWVKSPEAVGPRLIVPRATNLPRYSVIILTHNRLDVTKPCLESLLQTSQNYELIIVDNASTDGTVDWITHNVKNARIIRNSENKGVAKARNQGIRETSTDYVVMMDNDVVLQHGWFEDLYKPIQEGADAVGIEGWQIDHSFQASYKCVKQGERFDYLGGACTLFRRRIFETVGLLDEGFSPAYYEDVDMSIRAKNGGFKLAWNPTNKIHHKEHATLIHGQKEFNYNDAIGNSHRRFAQKMRRELKVQHEILPKAEQKFNIMYLGMQWDYGFRERGESFEHANFFPAVKEWKRTGNFYHFDFVDIGKTQGIQRMSDILWDTVKSFQPDVMFCVFFDENHDPRREMIQKISTTTKTKTIGWFCDSHFRYDNFDKPWSSALQYNVTTSASAYQRYLHDGLALKVIKSQWGTAPGYRKMNLPKDIDVSFVGQPHGDRRQVIDQIRNAGINIQCFGTGWPQRLSFDGMIQMFNRSKINLNLNNACDTRFKQIKGRNFEVPGCGGFLLTGRPENLEEYYELGKEIVTFDTTADMIEKIKYYLAHEEEREKIAEAGYQRTLKDHTYSTRLDHIFAKIGL